MCSIEGDILVSNLIRPEREASSYLIPSLSMLKGKVDRVFGSQPMIPLSQKRKDVDVDVCGSRSGKEQFRVYAEVVLGIRDGVDGGVGEKKGDGGEERVIEKDIANETSNKNTMVNENTTVNESITINPTPTTSTTLITNETPTMNTTPTNPNPITTTPINTTPTNPNPINSTPINSTPTNTNSMNLNPNPITTTPNHPLYRRYRFTATPPSPSSLPSLLHTHGLPAALFPIVHQVTDFDTNSVLVKCRLADDLPRSRGTRCDFWREIFSQQFPSQPQRLFRRYVYAKQPPRLSAQIAPSALPTQTTVFLQLGTL